MRRFALAVALSFVAAPVLAQGRVEPRWESIDLRPTPAWFEDAKLGIFIHWGVYAVPSFAPRTEVSTYARYSEWYWKRLMTPDMEGHKEFKAFHDRVYGPGAKYQDFAPHVQGGAVRPRSSGPTSSSARARSTSSSRQQAPRRLLPLAERAELELERGGRRAAPRPGGRPHEGGQGARGSRWASTTPLRVVQPALPRAT